MSIQVHFNEVELSVLSISRTKLWIFANSILHLLYDSIDEHPFQENDVDEDASVVAHDSRQGRGKRKDGAKSGHSSDNEESEITRVDNSSKSLYSDFNSLQLQESSANANANVSANVNASANANANDTEDNNFMHIAISPCECTIICSTWLIEKFFKEPLAICQRLEYDDVHLLPDHYLSLIVDSDGGCDKSLRILELTKPLSENGISIFYISSHFNDIVLIPFDSKQAVMDVLTTKNFEFSEISNSFISNHRALDPGVVDDLSQVSPIYEKTFEIFAAADIHPEINEKHELLLTGSRPGDVKSTTLKAIKLLSLATTTQPTYFVLTRTFSNELSIIIPESQKFRLKYGFDSTSLIGSTQDIIVPVTMDFSNLPLNCTGIVAGLANMLITKGGNLIEIGYLSMAKSGVIMIPQENLESVKDIMRNI
ncbi:uncharacterized protein LODBEIA_P39480 [Lodderomyces beijingensis]|uniref:CASTOR ACT domain-containing protein n=1 Tax=Lodderomyces beijingensis TaxID=1775926 RepID=A0ABP0ZP82_9ASCO